MPRVSRPDGAELHWEDRGQGPTVVIANQFFAPITVFGDLIELLGKDHRVITYDPRGIGPSTGDGPYDIATDAEDLAVLIADACDEPVVIVTMADGANRAVKVAANHPELVRAIVCVAGNPVGRTAIEGGEGLAASESVIEALLSMMETDYRGAMRTMVSTANPDLDEDAVRVRVNASVERCPQSAAAPRMRSWIEDEAMEPSRAAGDKLWILEDGSNPWFMETTRRTAELLPEAHVHQVEDGAISRPDIAAGFIAELTGVGAAR
jgi:pimeloyl-ACP methyl ester carboxylesterase